ncbi:hypothetical protein Bca52824_015255 [Brassica carinata]|uniref:Uncharacterized protein n=1 Tax=Brassica carinata TaxID=52824 RepID=A0A8X8B597_BRACI|nr:hypothetical protein Bca52824_015255 [Brassica carinata]
MGQDYSYSQPSSTSESVDITSLFEAEAQIYADEADSSYCNAIPGPQMAWEPSHGAFGGVKVTGSSVPFPVL